MKYFMTISDGYIDSVSTGTGGVEITEQKYSKILSIIHNKPTVREGFDYRLKIDLTWEEYEMPIPVTDEEAITEDYEQALQEMGVDFND